MCVAWLIKLKQKNIFFYNSLIDENIKYTDAHTRRIKRLKPDIISSMSTEFGNKLYKPGSVFNYEVTFISANQ